jgi:cell division protein FtsI/penicillin-binding protein 2
VGPVKTAVRRGFCVVLLAIVFGAQRDAPAADQLYAQSAGAQLAREFPSADINYLLIDPRSGALLASRWPNVERAIPIGSLVKPFTAVAYGETHSKFPKFICHGTADLCWRPGGHGGLDLPHALAQSCNAYFRNLATEVAPQDESRVLLSFGLAAPALTPAEMTGLGESFRAAPLTLARAYAALVANREREPFAQIVLGMQLAAQSGTARIIARTVDQAPALAKTGTAPCVHGGAPGDGYAVVLYPADSPRLELLVRVHSAPGAQAAAVAARMLLRLLEER